MSKALKKEISKKQKELDKVCDKKRNMKNIMNIKMFKENVLTKLNKIFQITHFCSSEFTNLALYQIQKNYKNFTEVEWNRFTLYHGKSLCDSHFSVLSKWLKNIKRRVHFGLL